MLASQLTLVAALAQKVNLTEIKFKFNNKQTGTKAKEKKDLVLFYIYCYKSYLTTQVYFIAGLKKNIFTFNISSNSFPSLTPSRLIPRPTDPSDQRTPVMTAPLQQLRDARRMDSSITLKPMTQQQDTVERETPRRLWLVSPAPHARCLVLQSLMNSSEGLARTLSLSLSTSDTPHLPLHSSSLLFFPLLFLPNMSPASSS